MTTNDDNFLIRHLGALFFYVDNLLFLIFSDINEPSQKIGRCALRHKPQRLPKGASYLYWVGGVEDAQCFENYLAEHPGAIAMWLGGHTHAHPDARDGEKRHIESKWGA